MSRGTGPTQQHMDEFRFNELEAVQTPFFGFLQVLHSIGMNVQIIGALVIEVNLQPFSLSKGWGGTRTKTSTL